MHIHFHLNATLFIVTLLLKNTNKNATSFGQTALLSLQTSITGTLCAAGLNLFVLSYIILVDLCILP
jgi:hypothetical protein